MVSQMDQLKVQNIKFYRPSVPFDFEPKTLALIFIVFNKLTVITSDYPNLNRMFGHVSNIPLTFTLFFRI